jgi:hypothetical protein
METGPEMIASPQRSIGDEIRRLPDLHSDGALRVEEFERS